MWENGRRMMAAAVDPNTGEAGRPVVLFEHSYRASTRITRNWDVTLDGERFLFVKRPSERTPRRIMLVSNWVSELERQLGQAAGR